MVAALNATAAVAAPAVTAAESVAPLSTVSSARTFVSGAVQTVPLPRVSANVPKSRLQTNKKNQRPKVHVRRATFKGGEEWMRRTAYPVPDTVRAVVAEVDKAPFSAASTVNVHVPVQLNAPDSCEPVPSVTAPAHTRQVNDQLRAR
jgi:hypothetical protein